MSTTLYLRSEKSFIGKNSDSSATHDATNSLSPCNMVKAAGDSVSYRTWTSTPSGDIRFGSWVSPCLKAATYTTPLIDFAIAQAESIASANFYLRYHIYLLRNGVNVGDILALVTAAGEADVVTTTNYSRFRFDAKTGLTFTAQDGDRICFELLGTAASGNLLVAFGGSNSFDNYGITTECLNPASMLIFTTDLQFLWDDLLGSPDKTIVPIVQIQSTPNLVMSTRDIDNVNQPIKGTVKSCGDLSRTIGDEYGALSVSDIDVTVNDIDGTLRQFIADENTFISASASVYMMIITSSGIVDYSEIFRGTIYTHNENLDEILTFRIRSNNKLDRQVPTTVFTVADFPECPTANVGMPVPIYYGTQRNASSWVCVNVSPKVYFVTAMKTGSVSQMKYYYIYKDGVLQTQTTDYIVTKVTTYSFGGGYILTFVVDPGTSVITAAFMIMNWTTFSLDPIDTMLDYLNNFCGFSISEFGWDANSSWTTARTKLASRGMTFNGGVHDSINLQTLLAEWMQSFDCDIYLDKNGKLAIAVKDFAEMNTPVKRFLSDDIKNLTCEFKDTISATDVEIDYDYNPATGKYPSLYSDSFTGSIEYYDVVHTADSGHLYYIGKVAGSSQTRKYSCTSFVPSNESPITHIGLKMQKTGSPSDNIIVQIYDYVGWPGVLLATGTWNPSAYSSYQYYYIPISNLILPLPSTSTVYWVIISRAGAVDASNYMSWSITYSVATKDISDSDDGAIWYGPLGYEGRIRVGMAQSLTYGVNSIIKTVQSKYIGDVTTAQALALQVGRKHKTPQPNYITIEVPVPALSLDIGDVIEINHASGIGKGFSRYECQVRGIDYSWGNFVTLLLRGNDIFDGAILGDDLDNAATWTTASEEEKRSYLYLCDETTLQYSDGRSGKRLFTE